jgi:hypothetical protein
MRALYLFIVLLASVGAASAADSTANAAEGAQIQHLRERIRSMMETNRAEMLKRGMTNENGQPLLPAADDQSIDAVYRLLVVDPSFGLSWDEVPPPNLRGADAMKPIESFIATNGWNMWTASDLLLGPRSGAEKPLVGLPWKQIRDRPFSAGTLGGILYVPLRGFGPESWGVAYNPRTNRFPAAVNNFKALGDHWYVWTQTESPPVAQQYEGRKR